MRSQRTVPIFITKEIRLVAYVPQADIEGIQAQGLTLGAVFGRSIAVTVFNKIVGIRSIGENKADGQFRLGVQFAAEHDELVEADVHGILMISIAEQMSHHIQTVHRLAEFRCLHAFAPCKMVSRTASGKTESSGGNGAEVLNHIPSHAVKMVGGHEGEFINGHLAAGCDGKGAVVHILTVKHEG